MKQFTVAIVFLGALAAPVLAQNSEDIPEEGVARISLLSGDVVIRRGDSGESVAAERNAPLVARDHVIAGRGARVEIQFDGSNTMRLAPEGEVRLAELKDGNYLVQVVEGTVTFSVLRETGATAEIGTPTLSIRPLEKGTYRITVRSDGSTDVTARSGEAEVLTSRGSEILRPGRTLQAGGDPSDPDPRITAAALQDEWDRWNDSRDRDLERTNSQKYVGRDIYGVEELDVHGRWVHDPPYGWVWAPHVTTAWAPYRVGQWTWVNYYGWTWVSGDPWGWAPYHYGRWYHAPRFGWVWYPGDIGPRHYWKPALVAFFGWDGGGVDLAIGFGNVGWVPLAPHEAYRPWYGRGNRDVIIHTTVVNNISVINTYRNARFANGYNGVTSVSTRNFGRDRVTVNNYIHVTDRDLGRVRDVRAPLRVEPSRESRQRPESGRTAIVRSGAPSSFGRPAPRREPRTREAPNTNAPQNRSRPDAVASPPDPRTRRTTPPAPASGAVRRPEVPVRGDPRETVIPTAPRPRAPSAENQPRVERGARGNTPAPESSRRGRGR